jgi:nitrite reductase/ring-hydroxylating ferredoxin subunit
VRNPADRYVERLLAGRRPKAFAPTEEDLACVRAAVELAGSRADGTRPDDAFVDRLRSRLADQMQGGSGRQPRRRLLTVLRPGRRRFLRAGLLTATAFATGLVTEPLLNSASGGTAAEGDLRPSHGTWYTVATSDRLTEGSVVDFDLGAVSGFVQRTAGRLRAVSGVCTHQACRLTLAGDRARLACPCHGATFALDGAPLHNFRSDRPLPPLPRLAVRERDGRVQVYGPPREAGPPTPA